MQVSMKDFLEAGVHFGHQTRRWNPKMKKFIFTERNGIYIIDLQKTLACLAKAVDAVREISARGEPILFVGTKPQAAGIIREEAERSGQFFVNNRWLGGMLTNFRTIRQNVKRLDHLDKMSTDGTYEHLTKKEAQTIDKQRGRLNDILCGMRTMGKLPGLLIVVDTKKEKIAVSEAERLNIPICAILDTNCDPDPITYPIPGNDDAIRSIKLILTQITDAVIEGAQLRVDDGVVAEKEQDEDAAEAEAPRRERRRPHAPSTQDAAGDAVTPEGDHKRPRGHKPGEGSPRQSAPQSAARPRTPKPRDAESKPAGE